MTRLWLKCIICNKNTTFYTDYNRWCVSCPVRSSTAHFSSGASLTPPLWMTSSLWLVLAIHFVNSNQSAPYIQGPVLFSAAPCPRLNGFRTRPRGNEIIIIEHTRGLMAAFACDVLLRWAGSDVSNSNTSRSRSVGGARGAWKEHIHVFVQLDKRLECFYAALMNRKWCLS